MNDIEQLKILEQKYGKIFLGKERLGLKSYILKEENNNSLYLKKIDNNAENQFRFLYDIGVDNIIYPYFNQDNHFITNYKKNYYYISNFYESTNLPIELRIERLIEQLQILHNTTTVKRNLSIRTTRPKLDYLTELFDIRCRMIENYVRSVEIKKYDIFTMPILSNYHYILDAKKEMARLQKRIISRIKGKEEVDFVFVHNRPSIEKLLNDHGHFYLAGNEYGKIGISSLDYARIYLLYEDQDINFERIFVEKIFNFENSIYYDYFRFLVLLLLIKKVQINVEPAITCESFVATAKSIKLFFQRFSDNQEEIRDEDES